jgi:hypothetical protein
MFHGNESNSIPSLGGSQVGVVDVMVQCATAEDLCGRV